MKYFVIVVLLFICISSHAQETGYIPKHKTVILIDSKADHKYILDSSHLVIDCYDECDKKIWTFDFRKYPLYNKPRYWRDYEITYMSLRVLDYPYFPIEDRDKKALWISWDKCSGYVDLKTGKFREYGCD
jgi:hypothetical protein